MPHGTVIEIIPASAADVFRMLHDYDRRLEWDTLLQAAYLVDGATKPQLGVTSVCQGKVALGGVALMTKYIAFRPPEVAAVEMINRPAFFDTFAATIRHNDLPDGTSRIEYKYNFTARPLWLRTVLHPVMNWMFWFETRKRLRALRKFFTGTRSVAA
jgi:polyketide cyclase/dehydrase/lipid transport protein